MASQPDPSPATAAERCEDALYELRMAFDDDEAGDDVTDLNAAFATTRKAYDELGSSLYELVPALEDLTSTVDTLRSDLEDSKAGDASHRARVSALLGVAQMQRECLMHVFDAHEHSRSADDIDPLIEGVMLWPVRWTREGMLARILGLAIDRGAVSKFLLNDLEGPVAHEDLRAVLRTILATHGTLLGERVLELLPRDDLATIAPSLVVQFPHVEWPQGLLEMLLATSNGRAELARALRDPEFVASMATELLTDLPRSHQRELPLPVFQLFDGYADEPLLSRALSDSRISTQVLQQELRQAKNRDWQSTIGTALHQRGVRSLGAKTTNEDAFVNAWRRALALAQDDPSKALQLWHEVRDEISSDRLCDFLRPIVVRKGTAVQLASIADELDEQELAWILKRFRAAERHAILQAVPQSIELLPPARDAAGCAALWAYAKRVNDYDATLAALCRSQVGLRFAQQHIAAMPVGKLRTSLDRELCYLQGLDPDTGMPPLHEPWLPLLYAVSQRGVRPDWTTQNRQRYDRLRRLRGVR